MHDMAVKIKYNHGAKDCALKLGDDSRLEQCLPVLGVPVALTFDWYLDDIFCGSSAPSPEMFHWKSWSIRARAAPVVRVHMDSTGPHGSWCHGVTTMTTTATVHRTSSYYA